MILARAYGELGLKHARVDIDTIEQHDLENNVRWQISWCGYTFGYNSIGPIHIHFFFKVTLTIKCEPLEDESL